MVQVDEWLEEEPLRNARAKPTPFQLPTYQPKAIVESDRLDRKADKLFEEGREANQTSDNYVLATIFFAAVLFFAGVATKFTSNRVAVGAVGFGTLVFLAGLTRLVTLPFH